MQFLIRRPPEEVTPLGGGYFTNILSGNIYQLVKGGYEKVKLRENEPSCYVIDEDFSVEDYRGLIDYGF